MVLDIFLFLIFGALSLLYSIQKRGSLLKQVIKPVKFWHSNSNKFEKRQVKRFKYFRFSVPLLDGLYSLYLIRKYGLNAVDKWITKDMEHEHIYELPMGPYLILLSKDASITHKLLSSSDAGHLCRPKSFYHRIFVDVLTRGLLGLPVEKWAKQRKIISRAFTFRSFQCYIESMNKHSKNLATELSKLVMENDGKLSGEKLSDCVGSSNIKITLEFIMGSEISDSEEAIQFSKDFWEYKEIVFYRFHNPVLYIPLVWWLHPKKRRADQLSEKCNAFSRKIVEYYRQKVLPESDDEENANETQGTVKRCLIEEMLKGRATPEEIHCEIGTFLVAGHETISTAVNVLLHHLACHPEYQAQCREEVDKVMGPYKSTFDEDDLSIEDLSNLEYLERFILESQRITPTAPFLMRELKSPLIVDGNLKLENSIFLVAPWITHRDPYYFPDPERFDPDRFLPVEVAKREPGVFFPFSGGSRNCIGRRFAMLAMKSTLAWILRNFEIDTEDGLHEVKMFYEATLRPEREYRTNFRKRKVSN